MRSRPLAWGLAAAAAYLLAAAVTLGPGRMPVRPLFDGTAPVEPYHWVAPPPDALNGNIDPTPGEALIPMDDAGSVAASVGTDDGQATISMGAGAFVPMPKQTGVRVHVAPADPVGYHVDPPPGLEFAGNAYEFTAQYEPGAIQGDTLAADVSIVLRYPVVGRAILRLDGAAWTRLDSTENIVPSLLLSAPTDRLGVYVVAVVPHQAPPAPPSRLLRRILTALGAVVLGGILALISRARTRRRAREAAPRPKAALKGKPSGKNRKKPPPGRNRP